MFKNIVSHLVLMATAFSATSSFAQSGSHGKIHHQQQQQQQQQGGGSNYPLYKEERILKETLTSCVVEYDKDLFKPLRQAYDSSWLFVPYLRRQKIRYEYRKLEKKFNTEFMPKSSPACAEQEQKALDKLKDKITSPEKQ